ncbi:MAG: hypothetical protein DWQ04_22625 [Chloroflexi bacterium]|nr:MAG: hypothetical protein DWQ04_22625 [Chloroflexota bacterium]
MNADERRFEEKWLQMLRGTAVSLLVLGIVGSFLVRSGLFDPKPVGELQESFQPVGKITVGEDRKVEWLDVTMPDGDFSVRGTAVYQSGSPDSLYGFLLGNETENIIVAVSPLGYVTIEQSTVNNQQSTINQPPAHSPQSLFPFQTWPHVRTGTVPNEIWIDVIGNQVTVWLNRELLWVGEVDIVGRQIGVVGESFGETAVFDFKQIQLFWEENHE